MAKQSIYTVGGTVQAGGGIYIKRKADDELLELCRQGEFAFILSSRQIGKSSLMVRAAQKLEEENICSVTIDLSAIGVKVSPDEWYLGILSEISTSLNLETNIFNWWAQYAQLGPAQRLTNFFKDVLSKEVKERIVLFFDEIDSTLSIPFSDDFYVAIRAVYNARSTNPDLKRLSFVLVGVATPSDLISDNKRTPFNIGRRVEINDFTLAEALPLAQGLGEQVLALIFQFTGGHPYLTQRLCAYLANSKESLDEHAIANAVERLFTGEQGKQDNNLQFVRDMLSKRSPDVTKVLLTYRDIRSGKKVKDEERSITKAHLKLSGLVRSEKGILRVRNEIYNIVFNPQWIQKNTPKNWQKIVLISLSATLGILMLATLAITAQIRVAATQTILAAQMTTIPLQRTATALSFFTPGIGSTMISEKDGMILVYVPSGPFMMGNNNGANEKPVHTVYLDAFWIDKTEVTVRMYYLCVEAGVCKEPIEKSSFVRSSYYGNAEFDRFPVIHVDWSMAKAYCEWVDRRLPTEAEWEKAARGDDGRTYPWGNDPPNNVLLNYNYEAGDTTEVGKYPDGASPYGALDMAGNVSEWVEDWYSGAYYANSPTSNPLGPDSGEFHILRGGSYAHNDLTVRSTFRFWNARDSQSKYDGFRCARSP